MYAICQRRASFEDLLDDPLVGAVHINSPIHMHAPQSVAALTAGKNYMMMETALYTREFLFIRELRDTGKLGRIQFMRGCHQQEMAGWHGYWEGLPPMH